MAPTREKCVIPDTPATLAALLDSLAPETGIELQKKGGKTYATIQDFAMAPTPAVTIREIARAVQSAVLADGPGYFAAVADGCAPSERVSWYAHRDDDETAHRELVTSLDRRALAISDFCVSGMRETIASSASLFRSCIDMVDATTAAHTAIHTELREAARDQADVQIAAVREQRLEARENMIAEFARSYMASRGEDKTNASALQVAVAARLTPDDFDLVKKDDVGAELFNAKSATDFRSIAIRLVARIKSGDLKISKESMGRLTPWVESALRGGPG